MSFGIEDSKSNATIVQYFSEMFKYRIEKTYESQEGPFENRNTRLEILYLN